jgi:ABC-2 type transport system ATP-binding protein
LIVNSGWRGWHIDDVCVEGRFPGRLACGCAKWLAHYNGAAGWPLAGGGGLRTKGRSMVSLDRLSKRFGIPPGPVQTAVDEISFAIPPGQIVGFLGPNGAGKSTTLKMLTGMLQPTCGTATICGFDLLKDPLEVKKRVGFVPESAAVFESLTGLEYLEMVASLYAIPREAALERIRQFISFFDLSFETLTEKLLGAYSKGMRRKVVITSALLHNPPVVFFDEPLDGLDANAAVGFKTLIQTLAREGKTIVYSSHILDVVERVCHRVIIIDKGKLLLDGAPEELIATHQAATLEQLFTRLTGGTELERRAQEFARTFRP